MAQLESFFWGIVAALGALFVELVIFISASIEQNPQADLVIQKFFSIPEYIIAAVIIEEFFKYLLIAKRVDMFSLERTYIVNSLFMGMGFYAVEIALFANSGMLPSHQILSEIAIVHLGTAGIMGYIVATNNPKKPSIFLLAMAIGAGFHGAYNFLIQNRNFLQNYLILFMLGLLVAINIANLFKVSYNKDK